jgi:hypothetical protein
VQPLLGHYGYGSGRDGYNALGAVLWVGTWCGLGSPAGVHIVENCDTFERYKW